MFEQDAKLNLLIGTRCNNRCVFCLDRSGEPDEGTAETVVGSLDEAVAVMRRDRAAGGTEVAFGRLEPALDKGLLDVVRAAKGLGYETLHLTSNGRALASRKWAQALVDAGLNQFTVSLHAPAADVHDELSGRPRAFAQTVQGIENLVALRREHRLVLCFGVTVTARNLPLLAEHYEFLQGFTPRLVGLNALLYSGRAVDFAVDLSFRYAALEAELLRLLEMHRGRTNTRFAVLGVPFCALRRVPPEVVGLRESFRMPAGRMPAGRMPAASDGDGGDWVETGAAGETGFEMRHLPACGRCAMRPWCPGVSAGYVAQHGDGDIQPLDDAYRRAAETAVSLFPSSPFRYPVADPRALPERAHRLARALAHAARPDWQLAGISAVAHESQAEHQLHARFAREGGGHIALEVEPFQADGTYFRHTRRWGVTLADDAGATFDEPTAQARERLIGRLVKTLARLDDMP